MTAFILDRLVFHFYLLMININLNRYKMNNFLTTAMGPSELNAKERKIRLVTIVLAVFVMLVTLRWQFLAQPMFVEFAFTDRITETGVTSDLALITSLQRLVYFCVLELACLLGLTAVFFILKWCVLTAKGHYIAEKPLRALQLGGTWLLLAMVYDTLLSPIVVAVLTWNDPQRMTIPMPYFQSYSLFLLAAGIGFVVLGWIFRLALQIQQENEGFV